MRQTAWYIFCILGLATLCLSSPISKRETLDENDALDPAEQPIDPHIPISYSVGSGAALPRVVIPQGSIPHGSPYSQGAQEEVPYAQGGPQVALYPHGAPYPQNVHYPQSHPEGHYAHPQNHVQGYLPDQGHLPTHGVAAKRALLEVPTTTEDAVNFTPGQKVSLDLPDPLFGSGFGLVTDVSKAAGSFIQNSAERTAQIFEAMKPFFKFVFGVDSLKITRDVPHDNDVK